MRLLLIVIVSRIEDAKKPLRPHKTDVLPALARIGQETAADAAAMCRVSHQAVLLLAF